VPGVDDIVALLCRVLLVGVTTFAHGRRARIATHT
jgi:hypothetical protein